MGETPFTETEALLACLEENEAAAERIVKEMFPHERRALAKAADLLSAMCTSRCAVCDERMLIGDPRGYVRSRPFDGNGGVLHHGTCPLPAEASTRA